MVSSTADGSVVIDVDMDVNEAEKELARLKKRVFKLEDEIGEKTFRRSTLSSELVKARKELKKLQDEEPATLIDGQFADNSEYYKLLDDARERVERLSKELKTADEEIDAQNVSLEWTKQRYGEIVKVANDLKSVQESAANNEESEVSDQHISDLGKELAQLKQRLSELKKAGIGLGNKEFDDITSRISAINRELKEYEKNLTGASEVDLSGSAAKRAADEMFQGMADRAQETMKWVERYREQLEELEGRKSSLGLALGARDEYRAIESEIESVNQHLNTMLEDLDSLARSGALGAPANGSDIAEQRIAELNDELADLQQRQANLGLALGAKEEFDGLSAEIERAQNLIGDYERNLSESAALRRMAEDAEVADQHIVDLNRELAELKERQKELEGAGIGLGHQEYDDNTSRIAQIKQELKEYEKGLTNVGRASEQAAGKMNSIVKKLKEALQTGNAPAVYETLGSAVDSVAQRMGSVVGGAGKAITAVKNFGKAAVKAFTQAALGAVKLLDRFNVFPKMFSSIGKSLKGLGRTVKSALVFSVIYKGLSLVRNQMGAYLMVNAQFSTALRRLQGVLLTAFQPIYEVAVPALTTLINVLSRAIAAVTQFVAVLFGKTAKQAQANAKGLYEQAGATTAAGNAAEDAAKQMAAFDEINKLEGSKSAGGGGGGGAIDTGPLFDWEYEDLPFNSWGEALSAFLDKLLGSIPALKEAFKNFADWLNDLTKKLYDMFTFPGVLDKVKQLGRDLADALNYLVNQINWYQLGQALGAGLNLALNFLTSFLYTFDWIALGAALAAMINGLASEIDWYEFGRLLWSGFKIGLETPAGFILGLDMPLLAEAASNLITGFFDSMKETIDNINWYEIGEKIRIFLENIEWDKIADSVFGAIKSAFTASSDFFSGLLGEELKRTLTDMLIEISKYTLVIGTILALSGANIPLGLGLMKVGAASLAAAAVLDWEYVKGQMKQIISDIGTALGAALFVIGAILTLSGPQHIALGIGLMAAGAASLATALAINWDFIPTTIRGIVTTTLAILGAALLVLGAILTFSHANVPLGVGLIALGAVSLATAAAINWDFLPNTVEGIVSKVTTILSVALLVLGIILVGSGVALPLGVALIAAGAIGLVTVAALNWDAILEKLKSVWDGIKNWWNSDVKKFFTLQYWMDKGKEIVDGFLKGIQDAWAALKTWFSNAWNSLFGNRSVSVDVSHTGSFGGGRTSGGGGRYSARSMPDISTYRIPALAQGAVIPPNREFLAVLGDQRSGTNIEAPTSEIEGAVARGIRAAGAIGGNRPITVILQVDRRELGRVVYEANNEETQRVGVKLAEVRG